MKLTKSILYILILLLLIKVDFRLQDTVYCCGDDHDYYSHAETLAIDFDFDYSNQLEGFEKQDTIRAARLLQLAFLVRDYLHLRFHLLEIYLISLKTIEPK